MRRVDRARLLFLVFVSCVGLAVLGGILWCLGYEVFHAVYAFYFALTLVAYSLLASMKNLKRLVLYSAMAFYGGVLLYLVDTIAGLTVMASATTLLMSYLVIEK